MIKDSVSFIANTGVQFYRFKASFNDLDLRKLKFKFIEGFDAQRKQFWLDEGIKLPGDDDLYAKFSELSNLNYINSKKAVSEDLEIDKLRVFNEDELYESNNINQVLKKLERRWLPIPYFKKNNINNEIFGPTDWVRIYFERIDEFELNCVLLVDTTSSNSLHQNISPIVNENANENIFSIPEDDRMLLSSVDPLKDCEWMLEYYKSLFFDKNAEIERPFLKPVANYIFFIRLLKALDKVPEIHLLSDKSGTIDVDLVIDVGNSNTCAILFENPNDRSFNFNSVKRLELVDFSDPFLHYDASFSTRVIFNEANFSENNEYLEKNKKFQWPSIVRVGFEAEKLIKNSHVSLSLNHETKTYNSSPKRYLWDKRLSEIEWSYYSKEVNKPPRKVYKDGISQQLNLDGSISLNGIFGTKSLYSRRSLMTFIYLEIFSQAMRQINSIDFRQVHGMPGRKRRIKRILLSCPTAMIKEEQIALRKCAEEAMAIINKYNGITIDLTLQDSNIYDNSVEVIPSVKDLQIELYNLENRKEWIYDESTAAQTVVMYGLLKTKFDSNAKLMFRTLGKLRGNDRNRSMTVGSLDIGGGTSDLMICKYHYQAEDEITQITPEPVFWESFNLAGDDLLKELIQQIIIEGQIKVPSDEGCTGVIQSHLKRLETPNIGEKLNGFFGSDSNNIGFKGKLMRVAFINQIGIPLIHKMMGIANTPTDEVYTYEELFAANPPAKELLTYFSKHFGFDFSDLTWRFSSNKVNSIINTVFGKLINQVSQIMAKLNCDLVILSGRPTGFHEITRLFNKFHPVAPNRFINLNNYWIGRWYPFANENGFINDSKTAVTIGSLISNLGGSQNRLGAIRFNNELLKLKLISTADFVGNIQHNTIAQPLLTPKKNETVVTIHTLPFYLGLKRINAADFPSRIFYSISFNHEKISEILGKRSAFEATKINDAVEDFKSKLRKRLPFKATLSRDFERDKEHLILEEIQDNEGNEISKSNIQIMVQSLNNEDGFWLDSGEFILSIN